MALSENLLTPKRVFLSSELFHWVVALTLMVLAGLVGYIVTGDPLNTALFVLVGSLAGYLTNDIAITLLFWPTEKKLGGRLHGFFFRRRDEFGEALISIATEKFLNPDLFESLIKNERVAKTLYSSVYSALLEMAEKDIGTPRTILAKALPERDTIEDFLDRISAYLGDHIALTVLDRADKGAISEVLELILKWIGGIDASRLVNDSNRVDLVLNKLIEHWLHAANRQALAEKMSGQIDMALMSEKPLGQIVPANIRLELECITKAYVADVILNELHRISRSEEFKSRIVPFIRTKIEEALEDDLKGKKGLKKCIAQLVGREFLKQIPEQVENNLPRLETWITDPEFKKMLFDLIDDSAPKIWAIRPCDLRGWFSKDLLTRLVESVFDLAISENTRSDLARNIALWLKELCEGKQLSQLTPGIFIRSDSGNFLIQALADEILVILSEADKQLEIKLQCRIQTRRVFISFLDMKVPKLADIPYIDPAALKTLYGSIASLAVKKLHDLGPSLVREFPIQEELKKLWRQLTNENIRGIVTEVLSREFKTLVNLGISFGATVAFIILVIQKCLGPYWTVFALVMLGIGYKFIKIKIK